MPKIRIALVSTIACNRATATRIIHSARQCLFFWPLWPNLATWTKLGLKIWPLGLIMTPVVARFCRQQMAGRGLRGRARATSKLPVPLSVARFWPPSNALPAARWPAVATCKYADAADVAKFCYRETPLSVSRGQQRH